MLLQNERLRQAKEGRFQCPHELELLHLRVFRCCNVVRVSMPSRAYTSFLHDSRMGNHSYAMCVNALSGLYLISTLSFDAETNGLWGCQCPLGLIPHFYGCINDCTDCSCCVSMPSRAYTSFLLDSPDGDYWGVKAGVNALSGLYLISTG